MKKKTYEIKKCILCGAKIKKRKNVSIVDYSKRKFCKVSCQHKWNALTKSSDIECTFCGKKFRKKNSQIGENNFCSLDCASKYKTLTHSKKVICSWCGKEFKKAKNQIRGNNYCSQKCMGEWQTKFRVGESNYNWKGGLLSVSKRIRSLNKYTDWRKDIFKRDNFTCQCCGDKTGGNLNAHHKKQLLDIIKEYHLNEMIDVLRCEKLWDLNNGITLCENCHRECHQKKGVYENIKRAIQ